MQTVCKRKNINIPPVEMRKSGLRPTRSHNNPPVQAKIKDHKFRNALMSNCSTGSVTGERNDKDELGYDIELKVFSNLLPMVSNTWLRSMDKQITKLDSVRTK